MDIDITTNELVQQIKSGKNELMPQLWEHIQKFIKMQAGKKLDNYPDHLRLLQDDMINQSYFYLSQAIENYDPEKGSFLNYLNFYLPSAFSEVINGGRTARSKNDPLNNYISYETPVSDTEDLTIADTLLDETSEAYYRRLEDKDFWRSVSGLLGDVIGQVKDETGRELVRYMYNHNCSIKEASRVLYGGTPVPYEYYRKALKEIRMLMKYSAVKKRVELIGLDDYISYTGTGLNAYKNRCFTSSVEAAAVKRADADLKASDIVQILT